MAEQPYTDEAVQLVADIVASLYGVVTVESIGETVLRELAAAGRLLSEGASEEAIRTEGYQQAVEALRDSGRYKTWHAQVYERTGVDHHRWHADARRVLADYLEAVGPVPINKESADG